MSSSDSSKRIEKRTSQSEAYPALEPHEEDVFITVKTYPRPSISYKELVCTAGITKQGKWIRLYPIPYRYLAYPKWFKKNQWVRLMVEKNKKDFRKDSYRPDPNSIKILSVPYDSKTDRNWEKRKEVILPTVYYNSLEEIKEAYRKSGVSLGIFKPKEIVDFVIDSDSTEWSAQHVKQLKQLNLFEPQPKPLAKIPFKFSYRFLCNDKKCVKPHKLVIVDWEVFALYLNIQKNYPYAMDEILTKVKETWLSRMWNEKRDSYLIVGTQFPNPTFMVLGVFWPPKEK